MAIQLQDENGVQITGRIKMVFVCDMCENTADYYNGMSTYSKIGDNTKVYCSEICVRKAVA